MKRIAFFVFGLVSHGMFLGVYLYFAGFVGNLLVPKTIDSPAVATPLGIALGIDLLLLAQFAVPHSVMARPRFKRWWTQYVPRAVERSAYVFIANLSVMLLMWQWRPIGAVVWDVRPSPWRELLWGLFATGWLLVPLASLMINHFDLFGTRQVWLYLRQKQYTTSAFRTPMLYKLVRHPLYAGWMTAFWATPTMSVGHLLLAAFLTIYMFVAIPIEERDLVDLYGEEYEDYRRHVPALIPRPGGLRSAGVQGSGDAVPVAESN